MATYRNSARLNNRVAGRKVEAVPGKTKDGRVLCLCGGTAKVLKSGRLSKHRDPRGYECPIKAYGREVVVDVSQVEVDVPPAPKSWEREERARHREPGEPSRLDAGSSCEDCGKWLPGERRLCGQCFIKRGNA